MIYPLQNPIKNFQWGSITAMSELFAIPNPKKEPQAELWMGAHTNGSSLIEKDGEWLPLKDIIENSPIEWLGEHAQQFLNQLPFLVKILAAEQPLSIQVHPSKQASEIGFSKENKANIPLDAPNRNYRDANHKPELVYAITPYLAMNGFRDVYEIAGFFSVINLPSIKHIIDLFLHSPSTLSLKRVFTSIFQLTGNIKNQTIEDLLSFQPNESDTDIVAVHQLITELAAIYSDDIGLFSPLFLNVIELQPGEAMFLYAETPHAYLRGVGVEIMANSDNVLRAGLTLKHIDVPELISNTKFNPICKQDLLMRPVFQDGRDIYPIPVDDFKFEIIKENIKQENKVSSPEILLCLDGQVSVGYEKRIWVLNIGESLIISASTLSYSINSQGILARIFC
ncbi:mannose-6-phosphate isomerase, class I [Vibrio sp. 1CM2L]|uniref:mannose-6-phosphate isomerase, class I n=1 Tax=Vibrio sp. 1CM2L TaxID=2929166 RepID=UPI0020BE8C21|nr:mannose-6-phosphate isomerase, class I [Vibrio sp. 1CM2L]MCK8078702.1 mannose-6-phosphate isomerase, class I [Vibrio sp. 1CM2L]